MSSTARCLSAGDRPAVGSEILARRGQLETARGSARGRIPGSNRVVLAQAPGLATEASSEHDRVDRVSTYGEPFSVVGPESHSLEVHAARQSVPRLQPHLVLEDVPAVSEVDP